LIHRQYQSGSRGPGYQKGSERAKWQRNIMISKY
jgi:hypothetical protein